MYGKMKMKGGRKAKKKTAAKKVKFHRVRKDGSKGGLPKEKLTKSKSGKVVSKKKQALGKKNPWMKAVAKARRELKIKGFVILNRGAEGKKLYNLAKKYHKK